VTKYIDISCKMNYNRNRQFGRLIGTIISVYVQDNASGKLVVYGTARPLVLVAYRKTSQFRLVLQLNIAADC